jgi:hypothetical protein
MNKYKKFSLCIFFLLILASMQACKPKESVLTQNTTCQFPCWQNIQPGKSTGEETIRILSKVSFIDSPPSVIPQNIPNIVSYTSWNFNNNIREEGGWIAFLDDKVTYILFDENNHVKIAEMIDFYGKPEFISAISGQADTNWLQINWIYPRKGVLIIYFNPYWRPTPADVDITPNLSVNEVYYFDSNLYDQLLVNMFRIGNDLYTIEQSIQKWEGYGTYSYTEIR